jgi:ATP/ADP translocase
MLRKLGIEPGEGRIFAWSAAALFLVGAAEVLLQNLAETLFVKRIGVAHLPKAFLASSLLLVATTGAAAWLAARSDRLVLLPRSLAVLALALVPLWWLMPAAQELVPWVLVISEKQISSIALLLIFVALGDLLHARQAKRLFGPMIAGATLGKALGSEASGPLGAWLGVEALLLLAAVTLTAAAAAALPLRSLRPRLSALGPARAPAPRAAPAAEAREPSAAELWRESSLFRLLAWIAFASGLVGAMLYVQFQYVADRSYAGEQGFLQFISSVRAWLGYVTLAAQLLLVRFLYRSIGIPLSIALSPAAYLLGFLGLSLRMTPAVGSAAMVGTKLQDDAIYDPALRVIYNLFPEELRASAAGLLEGPLKRVGGVAGNVVNWAALALGSASWIGLLAIPLTAAWLGVGLRLWRKYPGLLLAAAAARASLRDVLSEAPLLDPATLRALVPELTSPDPARARIARELVLEAPPERAVPVLAQGLAQAAPALRGALVAALDRLLESTLERPLRSPEAARRLEALLASAEGLSERDRADLVQAYGRLLQPEEGLAQLERALADPAPAVRLAAHAALARRGAAPAGLPALDTALAAALAGPDAAARRTAREELRALLLSGAGDDAFQERLMALCGLLPDADQRADAAEALADVAARHGERAAPARAALLALSGDADPRVRAALLRFCGHAGLDDQTGWLVEHLGSPQAPLAEAAREGLRALGPRVSDTLLRELAWGGRRRREAILELVREMRVQPETLRAVYERELDAVERDVGHLAVLGERPVFSLLCQRLEERAGERFHTALVLLAAIRREARIAELAERLRDPGAQGRRRAIVLEALEATLAGEERARLMPLLEEGGLRQRAAQLGRAAARPSLEQTLRDLLADPDELTRQIAAGVALAAGFQVDEHEGVDAVEKMLHLRGLPLFSALTARQLANLARVVREEAVPAGSVIVREGDCDDRLFLIVEGAIEILLGERLLAKMGPGDFFGEIALFEGTPRTADAVARTRVRLLQLERTDLLSLIEEMPGIAVTLIQTLSRRVSELTKRLTV